MKESEFKDLLIEELLNNEFGLEPESFIELFIAEFNFKQLYKCYTHYLEYFKRVYFGNRKGALKVIIHLQIERIADHIQSLLEFYAPNKHKDIEAIEILNSILFYDWSLSSDEFSKSTFLDKIAIQGITNNKERVEYAMHILEWSLHEHIILANVFRNENISKENDKELQDQLEKYRNQKGKEWRRPLLELAKKIYHSKEYTDKTKALKEAFKKMPKEFQNKYFNNYTENESAIIRQFQRMN